MASEQMVPATLRDAIARDLRPVRPLRTPWTRALLLAPLGFVLLVGIPAMFRVRNDASILGPFLLWGLSIIQVVAGVALAGLALREVVPGRQAGIAANLVSVTLGVTLALVVTFVTFQVSPTVVPPGQWRLWNIVCFSHSFVLGMPVLLVILLLASRGLMWHPATVGALSGLAAGLMADSGWRAFCYASEPSHVLVGHVGAILALAAAGALLSVLIPFIARPFRRPRS